MSSAICFKLDQSEILSSGDGLKQKSERVKSKPWGYSILRHCMAVTKDQILAQSELKAFAGDKIKVTQKLN